MDETSRTTSMLKITCISLPLLLNACVESPLQPPTGRMNSLPVGSPALPVGQITVDEYAYGGTGCPQGTVNWVISPERDRISVFFDEYRAISDESGSTRVRKSCNLGFGLIVPDGFSVALVAVDFRGYVYAPEGAKTQLTTEYFFAGTPIGARFTHTWEDPLNFTDEDFFVRDEFAEDAVIWSACGDDVVWRSNNSIRAYSNEYLEASEIQVDSMDAVANLVYRLEWRQCEPGIGSL